MQGANIPAGNIFKPVNQPKLQTQNSIHNYLRDPKIGIAASIIKESMKQLNSPKIQKLGSIDHDEIDYLSTIEDIEDVHRGCRG